MLRDPSPFSGDRYPDNSARCPSGAMPCVLCGKPVKTPRAHLRVHEGGAAFVTAAEAEALNAAGHEASDMYYYPIGPDCLRRHPALLPYVLRSRGEGSPIA